MRPHEANAEYYRQFAKREVKPIKLIFELVPEGLGKPLKIGLWAGKYRTRYVYYLNQVKEECYMSSCDSKSYIAYFCKLVIYIYKNNDISVLRNNIQMFTGI